MAAQVDMGGDFGMFGDALEAGWNTLCRGLGLRVVQRDFSV